MNNISISASEDIASRLIEAIKNVVKPELTRIAFNQNLHGSAEIDEKIQNACNKLTLKASSSEFDPKEIDRIVEKKIGQVLMETHTIIDSKNESFIHDIQRLVRP